MSYSKGAVTSKGGTTIGFRKMGQGPAVVHGHNHGAAQDQGRNPAAIAGKLREFFR